MSFLVWVQRKWRDVIVLGEEEDIAPMCSALANERSSGSGLVRASPGKSLGLGETLQDHKIHR